MHGLERCRDLAAQVLRLRLGEGASLALLALVQRVAVEQLHDDVKVALGRLAEVVDADQAGVLEGCGGLGFVAEAVGVAAQRGEGGEQDLDRDLLRRDRLVLGREDDAHAAAPELARQAIVADRRAHARAGPLAAGV